MLVSVSGISDKKFETTVKKACEYYADLLLSKRISRNITIDLDFAGRLDKQADGYCEVTGHNLRKKPRDFEIQIQKNKSKRYMMITLAHEMVHLKQYAMGELDENLAVWKGKRVPASTDYWDQPWEIEAHGREYGLWSRFAKQFKVRYKRTKYERDT
jgi:hypothetical protein